jgi:hypothetical protein
VAALEDAMLEQSPSNSVHSNQETEPHGELEQKVSSLELENKLLKNEVASLNQEMATVLQRSKDAQNGLYLKIKKICSPLYLVSSISVMIFSYNVLEFKILSHNFLSFHIDILLALSEVAVMRKKMDGYQRNQSQSDQFVRELQSRESDLMEAIQAKDSQLGVLRIRLEEADKQVESKQQAISDLQKERGRSVRNEFMSTERFSFILFHTLYIQSNQKFKISSSFVVSIYQFYLLGMYHLVYRKINTDKCMYYFNLYINKTYLTVDGGNFR